jgi:uncharacterized membrane protein YqiK
MKIMDNFFDDKSLEYIQAFLKGTPYYYEVIELAQAEVLARFKDSPYYNELVELAEAETLARFKERNLIESTRAEAEARIAEEAARAEAEAKARLAAEAKAKADRIAGAVRLAQDYGLTIVQIVKALGLTDDEIAAVVAALKA